MLKKPITIITFLCVFALGLGYWVGLSKKDSREEHVQNPEGSENPKEPAFLRQGLVAYYPFNGNAKDESGNGHDGEVNGTTFIDGRSSRSKYALKFSGQKDRFNFPISKPIEHNFSFSFYSHPENRTSIRTESVNHTYGSNFYGDHHEVLIPPTHGQNTGEAGIGVYLGINGIGITEHSAGVLPFLLIYEHDLDDWNHFVVVVNHSQPKLYMNGTIVRQGLQSPRRLFWASDTNGEGIRHPGSYSDYGIGGYAYGSFKGKLDDFRIFDRVLSEEEVKELYEWEKLK